MKAGLRMSVCQCCMLGLRPYSLSLLYILLYPFPPITLDLIRLGSTLIYSIPLSHIGMIMDWRQMAGKPTTGASLADTWKSLHSVWSGGHQVLSGDNNGSGSSSQQGSAGGGTWSGQMDPRRGWIIAICWLATCGAECVLPIRLLNPRKPSNFPLSRPLARTQHNIPIPPHPPPTPNPRLHPHTPLQPPRPHNLLLLCPPLVYILLGCNGNRCGGDRHCCGAGVCEEGDGGGAEGFCGKWSWRWDRGGRG